MWSLAGSQAINQPIQPLCAWEAHSRPALADLAAVGVSLWGGRGRPGTESRSTRVGGFGPVGGGIGFTFLPSWATLFATVQPPVRFLWVLLLPARPLVHQLCSPLGAPVRGNSHSTFLVFAVLDSRGLGDPSG